MCDHTKRVLALATSILLATFAYGATFTVTTTANSGAGSLRQAILDANSTAGADTIAFTIAGAGIHTITPATPLPDITSQVTIDGYTQPGASANTLPVGTNATLRIALDGSSAAGNGLHILFDGCTVRGLVIHRFENGIVLDDASDTVIQGNYIGTDATGSLDFGNLLAGIVVNAGSAATTIGGSTPAQRNVISGNGTGIALSSVNNANLINNYIGLTAAGTGTIVSGVVGIDANSITNTVIGGSGANEGNVIAAQSQTGVRLSDASFTYLYGNRIGLLADGTSPAPNDVGVAVRGLSSFIGIGTSAAPNVIAHNANSGVILQTVGNRVPDNTAIAYNSIFDNGGQAIDLGHDGPDSYDELDTDIGENRRQNYPLLTSANALGGNVTVYGMLHSTPSQSYTIVFFHNPTCDREMETLLGSTTVTTNASGSAQFAVSFASSQTSGGITAIAMDPAFNTSEVSHCTAIAVAAQPEVHIGNASVVEGNAGTATMTFPLYLTAAPPAGATVGWSTADNEAQTGDNDYEGASGTVVFAAGQTTQTLSVQVNGDTNVEPNQSFFVNLTSPVNATLGTSNAGGTIVADDSIPSITIGNDTAVEGNSGTTPLDFVVTVSPTPTFDVSVRYVTMPNVADSPADFVAESGSITIPAGSTTAMITIDVAGDVMDETSETFFVQLYDPTNATIAEPLGQGTIEDDDAPPAISIGDASVIEGNGGTRVLQFTATLSSASSQEVTVQFTTANDSASAGSDYDTNSGTITFLPSQTTRILTVTSKGDPDVEPDETFLVNLFSPTNATIADGQATGTIINDDGIVVPSTDLAITKTAPDDEVPAGSALTYTIVVTNTGAIPATNVVITDVLPPQVTFVSASPSCSGTTTITCAIGTLAAGANASVTITVAAPNSAGATIANTATVSADQTDPDSTDNAGTVIVRTIAAAGAVPIPTASEWGLLSLLLVLATVGAVRMRL